MNAKEEKKIYPGGPEDIYNEALKESLTNKGDLHKLSLAFLNCDELGNFLRRYMMANIPNKALGSIPFETMEELGKRASGLEPGVHEERTDRAKQYYKFFHFRACDGLNKEMLAASKKDFSSLENGL